MSLFFSPSRQSDHLSHLGHLSQLSQSSQSSESAEFNSPARAAWIAATLGGALLSGCYVVPIQPGSLPPAAIYAPAPAVAVAPAAVTFAARLYPANEAASRYGMVSALVTNDLNGRGMFSTNIDGENFVGEATRVAGSSNREGVANGAGNRGSYLSCRYQMNSSTLGTGQCRLSNGAQFTMHVGG